MGLLVVKDPAETRERVLAAAGVCFSRFGLKKTTVDEIARAAGVGKGTVYLYFRGKDDVFLAVARERMKALDAAVVRGLDEEPGALYKLSRMLRNVIAALDHDPLLAGLLRKDPDVAPRHLLPVMNECQESALTRIEQVLKQGVASGEIAQVNTRLLAFAMFSLYQAFYFGPGKALVTSEEFVATMERLVQCGIAGSKWKEGASK